MRELNLCNVSDSELIKKVYRFVYNNHKLVMMVLEDGDFRFKIEVDLIIVTD